MTPFRRLPGSVRAAPGLEHRLWRRLPAIGLWGTVLPLLLAAAAWLWAPVDPLSRQAEAALQLWAYTMIGVVVLHWTLCFTLAIGCFIVRVMKGPAYGADAYPPAGREDAAAVLGPRE